MTRVSGQDYEYNLKFNFRTAGSHEAKFAAGSWSRSWGASPTAGTAALSGSNIPLSVNATGFHTFAFNHDTLTYSFVRTVFSDFAAYATAYGLTGDEAADDDTDGFTNGAEFTANTDPTRVNDALGPVITLNGNALVGVTVMVSVRTRLSMRSLCNVSRMLRPSGKRLRCSTSASSLLACPSGLSSTRMMLSCQAG
jgi:hypothetical protein